MKKPICPQSNEFCNAAIHVCLKYFFFFNNWPMISSCMLACDNCFHRNACVEKSSKLMFFKAFFFNGFPISL